MRLRCGVGLGSTSLYLLARRPPYRSELLPFLSIDYDEDYYSGLDLAPPALFLNAIR